MSIHVSLVDRNGRVHALELSREVPVLYIMTTPDGFELGQPTELHQPEADEYVPGYRTRSTLYYYRRKDGSRCRTV